MKMCSECVRVSVDYCYPNYTRVDVPFPTQWIKTIGQAHGTFVQWPKDQVILDEVTIREYLIFFCEYLMVFGDIFEYL